jgi:amidase
VGRLEIAYTTTSWTGVQADPEVAAATERAAALCEDLGHHVVKASPAIDAAAFGRATMDIWCGFLAMGIDALAAATGRAIGPDTVEASNLACYEYGKKLSAVDLYLADDVMNRASRAVAPFFASHDVLLTPTIAQRVAPIGASVLAANAPGLTAEKWVAQLFGYAPFTALFNSTGQPAVSLPLEHDREGVPIGMQFVGRWGDEARLFRLAASLEAARPWKDRRPAVWAGSTG